MDTMKGVSQRKAMASDGEMAKGDFGVKSFSGAMSDGKSMGSSDGTMVPESARCCPVGMGSAKMDAQANPNHGKHK